MRKLPLVGAAAFAALFLVCALPHLTLPGLNHDEAFQAAEAVLFLKGAGAAAAGANVSGVGPGNWLLGRWPWMTLPYAGALKTYLLAAVYRAWGIGVAQTRATTAALGAVAVFFGVLLGWELYGAVPAAVLGAWLATDPALVVMARHDSGPFILSTALKIAGLFIFASARREAPRRLFFGGVCFGLALWDKAHFLWFLAALAASVAVWRPYSEWSAPGRWIPAVAGVLLGALPLLAYNVARDCATFSTQAALSPGALESFYAHWPEVLRARWALCLRFLDGSGLASAVTGERAAAPPWRAAAVALLAATAAGACALPGGRWAWRHAAFWLGAAALVLAAAAATPLNVGLHHMPMLYPLPQLGVAALVAGACSAWRSWRRLAFLAVLTLACAAGNVACVRGFYASLGRTQGAPLWYTGLREISRQCRAAGVPVLTLNLMFATPLVVYSAGSVVPEEVYPFLEGARGIPDPPGLSRNPGALLVAYLGPGGADGDAELGALARWSGGAVPLLEPVGQIRYSDGTPWAGLWRVR